VTTVAVLGAGGTMGGAMARNVMAAGMAVRAWNRTRARAEGLAADGAHLAATPAEAADGADVVLTMLADGDAVVAAMDGPDGALGAMGEGAVWLQMSTIGEEATARCMALADGAGVPFADAPVLGTKAPAEQGALIVLGSGPDEVRERVRPVLDAVGQRTMWVGDAGAGTRLKLVTNAWILAVVEGTAEAIALAEGLGLEPSLLLEAVEGGPLDLPYLRMKAAAIADRDFSPSFRLALAAKDARLVEDAARAHGLDLPLAATVARRLAQAVDAHGDEDVSATYLTSAPDG
jgi:3-hydroxyisobutyrate dehydrogenase